MLVIESILRKILEEQKKTNLYLSQLIPQKSELETNIEILAKKVRERQSKRVIKIRGYGKDQHIVRDDIEYD